MKKNKNIDYYRYLLHKDTIFLLFVAIFFGISSFLLQGFDIFLKSILFICFFVISIFNKKENGIFIGRFNIFTGILMVLISIRGSSLFDIAYLLLGIIYIIHSIVYLVKLKKLTLNLKERNKNNSKVIYFNLILVIISMICFKLVLNFRYSYFGLVFILLGISLTLFIFISSLILIFKKYKSLLMYIIFILSIFIVFAYLIIAVRVIPGIFHSNSSEFKIKTLQKMEDDLKWDVTRLSSEGLLIQPLEEYVPYVLIDKKNYEDAILLWNEKDYLEMKSVYDEEYFDGYTCDGYVELSLDEEFNYITGQSFISCSGKYTYKTKGFDQNKLHESKSDAYYKMYNMKKLEYFFKDDVISFSERKLLSQPRVNSSLIITKDEYELLENDNLGIQSRFKEEELEGITCDGYVELSLDENSKIIGKPYINCSGKYTYTTEGFNEKN